MQLVVDGELFVPPNGYTFECRFLNTNNVNVPIVRLRPVKKVPKNVIVYSHGNGSDLSHALKLLVSLAELHET